MAAEITNYNQRPVAVTVATPLSEDALAFISEAIAYNTRRAYAAQLKLWFTHCEQLGRAPFPADPAAVANWIAERATSGERSGKRARDGSSARRSRRCAWRWPPSRRHTMRSRWRSTPVTPTCGGCSKASGGRGRRPRSKRPRSALTCWSRSSRLWAAIRSRRAMRPCWRSATSSPAVVPSYPGSTSARSATVTAT